MKCAGCGETIEIDAFEAWLYGGDSQSTFGPSDFHPFCPRCSIVPCKQKPMWRPPARRGRKRAK